MPNTVENQRRRLSIAVVSSTRNESDPADTLPHSDQGDIGHWSVTRALSRMGHVVSSTRDTNDVETEPVGATELGLQVDVPALVFGWPRTTGSPTARDLIACATLRTATTGDICSFDGLLLALVDLEAFARSTDLLIINISIAHALYPGVTTPAIAERLLALGAMVVVITDREGGAYLASFEVRIHIESPAIDVRDPSGAECAVVVALIDELLRRSEDGELDEKILLGMASHAAAAASLAVTRVGGPPTRAQIAKAARSALVRSRMNQLIGVFAF